MSSNDETHSQKPGSELEPLKIGILAGSFNPIHTGHLEVIQKALVVFDEVYVLVAVNPEKKYAVGAVHRQDLCREFLSTNLAHLGDRVFYRHTTRPVAEYAYTLSAELGATVSLVRGIRSQEDVAYEMGLAEYNRKLFRSIELAKGASKTPSLETTLFYCKPELSLVSSSGIRQLASVCSAGVFRATLCDVMPGDFLSTIWEVYHDAKSSDR